MLSYVENVTKVAKLNIRKTDLRLGFGNLNRLNRFIKVHRDGICREHCSRMYVVYKLQYNDCDVSRRANKERQLATRMKEQIKLDPAQSLNTSKFLIILLIRTM